MEPLLTMPSVADEFSGLTAEQTAEKAVSRLAFHYRRLLDVADLDRLRQAFLDDRLEVVALLEASVTAVAKFQKEEFARDLKARLSQL